MKFAVVPILLVMPTVTLAQSYGYGSLAPQHGELPIQQASTKARSFLKLILSDVPESEMTLSIRKTVVGGVSTRIWEVKAKGHFLLVNAATGSVHFYSNLKREYDRQRRRNRTGTPNLANAEQAKAYLTELGRSLGIPSSWALEKFRFRRFDNGSQCAIMGGVYRNGAGKVVATIAADPLDNKLLSFSRTDRS